MRHVILLALVVCPFAAAGEVYRCKGPKGDITFTNIKCPEHTAIEHYATYQPEEEPPPPAPAEASPPVAATRVEPSAEPARQPAARVSDPLPAQAIQPPIQAVIPPAVATPVQQPDRQLVQEPVQPEQPTLASGYKCSDGDSTWLQSTPCPLAAAHATRKPVERPTPVETPASAPSETKPIAAPQETGSSQGPLCDQLISQTATAGQRQGGTGTDELNKLLAANGCRR